MFSEVVYGLASAIGFGSADFLSRGVSQRVGFLTTLFLLQVFGGFGLLPVALIIERGLWQASDPWVLLGALAVLNLFASLALYRALEYGVTSIVAPLMSMAPAITSVLALTVLRERLSAQVAMGIAVVFAGVIALSRSTGLVSGPAPKDARAGLVSALVAMVGLGVMSFGLKFTVDTVGPITTIVALRLVDVVLVLAAVAAGRATLATQRAGMWSMVTALVVLDSAAFVAYATGLSIGSVAVVSTLSGLFSAVTVGLAALVLKERLRPAAYASIAIMLVGVVLIAAR